jgi:hypothetical protein
MAVTIEENNTNNETLEFTGLTSGNGQIVDIPNHCRVIGVYYTPTSAGTASVKYAMFKTAPTDFTNMPKTAIGDVTATGGQEITGAVRWVGLDPASGTWDFTVVLRAV